ncbi:PDR/VanB family oxidoreductase [Streptomyces yaizuensis]|uniref:PDR/VanB family oxidoreductase n=1 Tax=Streptomyces yaizuensis TaxID=2989713 RepID=A0ABQ5P849_9ACTN|nr:PDR/VanB family oxidoreductase [Streptomyces sp. YSPA8]GLF98762.1 PDR/VanB family oxidoreductase [Streptomyces sp. YSPA8]
MELVEAAAGPAAQVLTLRVTAKEYVADGVVALGLAHADGARLPDWTPGAHLDLVLPGGLVRPYSLCGDRWDAHHYRVAVLREDAGRGGSARIHDRIAVGDRIGAKRPRNNFPLVPSDRYLFLAGGIGITPLLPMIQQAELVGADWQLVYGGRRRASMAFLDQLALHGDRVTVVPEDECGRPDLNAWLGEVRAGVRVYCCGPAGLLDAVAAACAHWPPYTLRTERFAARARDAPVRDAPFEVVMARSGTSVTVRPGATVLDAVRSAGADLLSSCGEGTCGTCETAVVAGEVDHRDALLTDEERATGDRMYPCVSRSRGERLVLDL